VALLLLASQSSLMAEVVYLTIPGAVLVVPGGINNLGFISGTFYPGTFFLSFGEIVGSTVLTPTNFCCRWNPRGQVASACPVVAIH
jgi:hypothetical protein